MIELPVNKICKLRLIFLLNTNGIFISATIIGGTGEEAVG